MNEMQLLCKYLEDVTGVFPTAKPMPGEAMAALPAYLSGAYGLHEIGLFGNTIVVATPTVAGMPGIAQLAKERGILAAKFGRAVVLALPQIKSHERRRLVQKGVPFIVPGRQMFLPMLLVDFRESFPGRTPPRQDKLGWVAQMMLLRHLQAGDITGRPLAMLAKALGYTAMSMTQGLDELSALGLCERVREGRTVTIQFGRAPCELWRLALPHLRSPIKRRHFTVWAGISGMRPLHAGLTALSEMTEIAPSSLTVLATDIKEVRKALGGGVMSECAFEEDAEVVVEAWAYAPNILSEGPSVDPLSLYLTMKDDPDERVEAALGQLMERWA